MKTAFDQSMDDLAIISTQQKDLAQRRLKAIERSKVALIQTTNEIIDKHRNQLFVFWIKGSFEEVMVYGPRENKMRQVSFELFYIGLIGEGSIRDLSNGDAVQASLIDKNYLLPASIAYVANADTDRVFKEVKEVYLHQQRPSRAPTWTIEDLLRRYISEELSKEIFPRLEKGTSLSLTIGDGNVKAIKLQDRIMQRSLDVAIAEVFNK